MGNRSIKEQYLEMCRDQKTAVICGGGHISLALEHLLKSLEFYVVIIDDREEFANKERFLHADEVICGVYEKVLEKDWGEDAFYIVVTRGHSYDGKCLKTILEKPAAYIGMIGSKGKIKKTYDSLIEAGVNETAFEKVKAPIGLEIGAETPEEIAVSIAGEIIQVYRKKNIGKPIMSRVLRAELAKADEGVLVEIVEKKGSSPGKKGALMLVLKTGEVIGTIGGGVLEYQAKLDALEIMDSLVCVEKSYDVSNKKAENLGMICGGSVLAKFMPIKGDADEDFN